jgi:hypothetical protein
MVPGHRKSISPVLSVQQQVADPKEREIRWTGTGVDPCPPRVPRSSSHELLPCLTILLKHN